MSAPDWDNPHERMLVRSSRISVLAAVRDASSLSTIENFAAGHPAYEFSLIRGTIENLIASLRNTNAAPDIVIVELEHHEDASCAALSELADLLSETCAVYALGHFDHIRFYRALREMGIADYFVLPFTQPDMHTLFSGSDIRTEPSHSKTIGFISLAGGVGTSTLALTFCTEISPLSTAALTLFDMDSLPQFWALEIGDQASRKSPKIAPFDYVRACDFPGSPSDASENISTEVDKYVSRGAHCVLDIGTRWQDPKLLSLCDHIVIVGEPDARCFSRSSLVADYCNAHNPYASIQIILNKINTPNRFEFSVSDFIAASQSETLPACSYDAALMSRVEAEALPIIAKPLFHDMRLMQKLAHDFGLIRFGEQTMKEPALNRIIKRFLPHFAKARPQ